MQIVYLASSDYNVIVLGLQYQPINTPEIHHVGN